MVLKGFDGFGNVSKSFDWPRMASGPIGRSSRSVGSVGFEWLQMVLKGFE